MSMHQALLASYGAAPAPSGSTVSLLHFNGSGGSTTFTDESGKTWTRNAVGAQLSTVSPKFGSACLSNGSVGVFTADHADFDFGAGDFTIEFWTNLASMTSPTGGATCTLLSKGPTSGFRPFVITFNSNGTINCFASTSGSGWDVQFSSSSGVLGTGTWRHIAMVRDGATVRGFHEGTQFGSGAISGALMTNAAALSLMSATDFPLASTPTGRADEFRVSKGIARYTSNFTPPGGEFPYP